MSNLTRRLFLRSSAAAGAVAATVAVPAATVALPAVAEAATPEHPWDKAQSLASQLSEALAEGDGAWSGPGGKWYAEIHPATGDEYPIVFGNIKSREWHGKNVSLPCRQVIETHRQARISFEKCCRETDTIALRRDPSKAAERRWDKANSEEENALVAVCAFRPLGNADARAKAAYLSKYIRWGALTERHILALLNSTVAS